MGARKILIIDDNGLNGPDLSAACRRLTSGWEVVWFRVISPEPDPLDEELEGVTYRVIGDAGEAAEAIREVAGQAPRGLIVFYDLQLIGVQGKEIGEAMTSPITLTLKGLMGEEGRRMLVMIHSASLASQVIAEELDGTMRRTLAGVLTGREQEYIEGVVSQTLVRWEEEYPSESMTADEFLAAMGEMSHGQIQEYPGFLKETLEGAAAGTAEERGRAEAELRQRHPDPKEVLRVYLRMGVPEFEEHFCDAAKGLKGEVVEALKCIAGVDRRLSWGGAWLLALGVFRQLLPRDSWKTVFDPTELGANLGERWPSVHAVQRPQRRLETIRLFAEMCRVLFTKKGDPKQSVLEKVELVVEPETGRPQRLSFRLGFPCVGDAEDQSESLLGRLVGHLDTALAAAEGKQVGPAVKSRDTSRAIWRFFLSAAMCDTKEGVGRPGYGLAGGFSPMNIMSVSRNTKTEVLWLN